MVTFDLVSKALYEPAYRQKPNIKVSENPNPTMDPPLPTFVRHSPSLIYAALAFKFEKPKPRRDLLIGL